MTFSDAKRKAQKMCLAFMNIFMFKFCSSCVKTFDLEVNIGFYRDIYITVEFYVIKSYRMSSTLLTTCDSRV